MLCGLAVVAAGLAAQSDTFAQDEAFYIKASLDAKVDPTGSWTMAPEPRFAHSLSSDRWDTSSNEGFAEIDVRDTHDFVHGFDLATLSRFATGLDFPGLFRVQAEVTYLQHDADLRRAFFFTPDDPEKEQDKDLFFDEDRLDDIDVSSLLVDGQGKVETKATFANGFIDIPTKEHQKIKPYLGAGVGMAQVDYDYRPGGVDMVNEKDTVFAYQFMMGAEYSVDDSFDWSLSARYRGMGQSQVDSTYLPTAFRVESEGLVAEFGLSYGF